VDRLRDVRVIRRLTYPAAPTSADANSRRTRKTFRVANLKGENAMKLLSKTLAVVAACTVLATDAFAQSTVVPVDNEPAPRLIVEPPLPGPLAKGVVFIPYQVENLRILPVGGPAARKVSPRVGHLHITVDDLPWQWADYGQSNTIILVGMPRGQHKVRIEVVDAEGNVFTGQTMTFHSPGKEVQP
jgi:hypothetical protein